MSAAKTPAPGAAHSAPPTSKGRDTRRRIIDCTLTLFAERGYAGVTVVDITQAAGLSPGAFYRYFSDRYALTVELLEELTTSIFEHSRSVTDDADPIISIEMSTARYFEYYRDHSALFRVLVELSQSDSRVAELWESSRAEFYGRIAHSLRRAIRSGRAREDLDPDVAAELLGSMTEFYAFQRFVLRSRAITDVPVSVAARSVTEIWTRGIVADSPTGPASST